MSGRLSTWQAAFVIARRDFVAILWSRSFIFFLLGPLFPLLVGGFAGGIGQRVHGSEAESCQHGRRFSGVRADVAAGKLVGMRERGGGEEDEPLTESQQADELAFQQVCCDARCRSGTGFWRQHCYLTLRW